MMTMNPPDYKGLLEKLVRSITLDERISFGELFKGNPLRREECDLFVDTLVEAFQSWEEDELLFQIQEDYFKKLRDVEE